MKSSCKSFEVFDFKEEDELSELTAAKYTSKFGNSNAIDKYTFLEGVAQGTNIQSKEIGKILCVDVDADNSDHNVDSAASISSPDTGEDCAAKRMSGIDAVLQINSTTPDQLPQFRPNKSGPRSYVSGVEGSSSPTGSSPTGSSPTAASPDNSKLKFTLLEPPCSDESIDVASNADGSMGERSPSTSSDIAEDDDLVDGRSSDHCFGGWEMGDGDMTVVFFPDYVVYRDRYCTDSVLTFSSSCIEIKGSTACGDQGTFVFQWGIDDIINIESQWCGRFEMAMVKIRVISKDAAQAKNVIDSSGIEELKFAVVDSDWYEKQEVITSLDVYKALWNTVLDSDTERDGEALLGQNGEFFSKHYFPDFDEPFEDVVYPKGDYDAVSISKRDVDLLQPDTFVNDTIIDFYIKYLKNKIEPDEWHRFHFFNSFFFRKLADLDKDPSSAFDARAAFQRVRKWTRKVNLFEKDYVFIPVNFNYHWSLLVICHPGEVTTFQDEDVKRSLKVPCILHMDSIRGSHTGLKGLLQSYLWEEWKERQKETSEDMSSRFFNLRFVSLELPQQQNSFDCGLFLLHYAELFLEEAPVNFNPFKITKFSNFLNANWFQPAEASLKRVLIQRLIYDLLDNCSREISPNAGNDDHRTSNCPKYDGDNEMAVEFLCKRSICSKAPDGNVSSSQAGLGIEITLLPTSSLKSSQCASDSGLVLRELFGPEAAVRSLLDAQYQTFNQTAPFDEFKSTMSPIEEEEGEAGAHFVCSPLKETGLQQLGGITSEVCVFPYSSKDLRAEASWNPAISVHQARNEDTDPSPETSISDSDSSIEEIEENENGHVGSDFGLKEKMDQPISPSTEKTECVTECFASAPSEMMDADSVYSVQMLKGNDNAVSLASCPKNLLGFPSEETDMRLISYDSRSESDVERAAKKMRLTPPLEGEGGLTRSLSNDLHL